LQLQFDNNVLAETNNYKLIIDNKEDLSGLPETVIKSAKATAEEYGLKDKWVFTTHKPSMLPFLTYSDKRDLREKLHKAYIMRGDNNNEYDNKKILAKIASLTTAKAHLFGFKNYAEYVLDKNMAKNPETVFKFTNKIWDAVMRKMAVSNLSTGTGGIILKNYVPTNTISTKRCFAHILN